eukprot:TRINITY_DN68682_c0_g1_i1.p1 TRINITY_DN68682_c0_g1~~TRINITY_DN68682_c0_g1_i1.p1  ORF type:complete len:142 (+),score=15.67 TRINITY_DN68682_c0_g1_i1:73-498(+)
MVGLSDVAFVAPSAELCTDVGFCLNNLAPKNVPLSIQVTALSETAHANATRTSPRSEWQLQEKNGIVSIVSVSSDAKRSLGMRSCTSESPARIVPASCWLDVAHEAMPQVRRCSKLRKSSQVHRRLTPSWSSVVAGSVANE